MKKIIIPILAALGLFFTSCKKNTSDPAVPGTFSLVSYKVNEKSGGLSFYDINLLPTVKFSFSAPVNRTGVPANIYLSGNGASSIPLNVSYENNDSTVVVKPIAPLNNLTRYTGTVLTALESVDHVSLGAGLNFTFLTSIDSTDKFPQISDSALLTLIQQQTFKYFWDLGHPVSGMARERNSSGDLVTSGGTGFGLMSIPVAINRNFITRAAGLTRSLLIVNFLKNNCTRYHGAFSHWINGTTGATIPFSSNDNGADLVETSYLMEGLLTARQFFNSNSDVNEIALRNTINQLWDGVEWNWFRQNNQNVLYWQWSPTLAWIINAQVSGWNEALITYVMASSSRTDSIPKIAYDNGWAKNGNIRNGNSYFGYILPLGPSNGGPMFFEHYSFLGINPVGLTDAYANYQVQTTNHTKINFEYCKADPRNYFGYSNLCWGLTASDIPTGYAANEPNNDNGVIAPTAAVSSLPYTPAESMQAIRFFYYKLGDKLWGQYGFYDAFKLQDPWFATSTLAIDEGPIIIMIENYRTGLVWNLFTSAPEIKNGMKRLGFTASYL